METEEIPVARESVIMTSPPLTARELKLIDEKRVVVESLHHALGTMCAQNEQLTNRVAELEEKLLACSLGKDDSHDELTPQSRGGEAEAEDGPRVARPYFPIKIPPIEKSDQSSGPAPWWVEGFVSIYGAVRAMTAEVANAGQDVSDKYDSDDISTECPTISREPPPSDFQVRGPEEFDIGLQGSPRHPVDVARIPTQSVSSVSPLHPARAGGTPSPRAETPPPITMPPPVVASPLVRPLGAPPILATLSPLGSSRVPTPPPGPPPEREFAMPTSSTFLPVAQPSSAPKLAGVEGGVGSAPPPPNTIGFGSMPPPSHTIGFESVPPPPNTIGFGSMPPPSHTIGFGSVPPPPNTIGFGSMPPTTPLPANVI